MQISRFRCSLVLAATLALAACGGGDSVSKSGGSNNPPLIQGTPPTDLTSGTLYTFQPTAADPDGDPLSFSASNLPAWASIDTQTGLISGTPTEADVGTSEAITVSVSDSQHKTDLPGFKIKVHSRMPPPPAQVNLPPTIAGMPGTTATVGMSYTFTPVADDVDGDTLVFSITNKPGWAMFSQSTGQLSGNPAAGDVGTTSGIVISVSDGTSSTALPAFSLQVVAIAPANRPPVIAGNPPTTATVGTAYSFRPTASDPDGNTLQYSIVGLPRWATFSTTTGRISGTPATGDIGASARITISVSDNVATVSLPSFTIQVSAPPNRAPTISGTPGLSVNVGSAYSFQPTASDPDGNALSFNITNQPPWATFSTSTGRLSGTPGAGDVGSTSGMVISVSDGTVSASLPAFAVSVVQVSTGSASLSWTAPTTNTDGSALTTLSGYRLAYGQSATSMNQSVQITNPGLTSYTVSNLATGTWYFALYAQSSTGTESNPSNTANKLVN